MLWDGDQAQMTVMVGVATAVMVVVAWSWPVPPRRRDSNQAILHTRDDDQAQARYEQIATRTDLGHRRRRAGHRDRRRKRISVPTTNQYGQPGGRGPDPRSGCA